MVEGTLVRCDTADDAGAATERDHGDTKAGAGFQQRDDRFGRRDDHDGIRRLADLPGSLFEQVEVALPG
ncbi:MAG: hypothetical protein IPK93_10685 [Solirubrobacterales bacterium]|nr:hypothetical protein [Solirubrobacterales bacterium]